MKDITHYFTDLQRASENATPVAVKEVSAERAKINDDGIMSRAIPKLKTDKKRKRSKTKEPEEKDPVSIDLDRPNQAVSNATKPDASSPKKKTPRKSTESNAAGSPLPNGKPKKSNVQAAGDSTPKRSDSPDVNGKPAETSEPEAEKSEEKKLKQSRKEKLVVLAEKKGYSKRKLMEEEEAAKIDVRLKKRKKYFTVDPDESSEIPQSNENSPKNTDPNVKRPGSLLNYFSKVTPEQLENERLKKTKVTTKAEVHTPQNSPVAAVTTESSKKKSSSKKRKVDVDAKKSQEEFDEIQLLQTETVVLSPKNEIVLSPTTQQKKPKWSMKIQLQVNTSDTAKNDEIHNIAAPANSKKGSIKNTDEIPKVLLPLKHKKHDLNDSLDDNSSKNSKEERKGSKNEAVAKSDHSSDDNSSKNGKEEKKSLKNEKIKTEAVAKSDHDNISKNGKEERKSLKNEKIKTEAVAKSDHDNSSKNGKEERKSLKDDKIKNETVVKSDQSLDDNSSKNGKEEKKNLKNGKTKTEAVAKSDQQETKIVNLEKETADDDCQIIKDDFSNAKSKEKLAPLFKKKLKRDPEFKAAQRLFLQSDIQETSNPNNGVQKPTVVEPPTLPFPKIGHINQLVTEPDPSSQPHRFPLRTSQKFNSPFDLSHLKTVSKFTTDPSPESSYECAKTDLKTLKSEIESYCPDIQNLWDSITQSNPTQTPKSKKRPSDRKILKQMHDNLKQELHDSPWTEKYKPTSSSAVVGNEEAATKLKTWLNGWRSSKNNRDYSSSDEFYTSDDSMASNPENNQVAVLVGPHGSGKTASIYAVARELGYKVLEVNASSRRPGKKILKDFEEATKSHRVKNSSLDEIFKPKPKKKTQEKKPTTESSHKTLILMEDVDLVFEEDEGFVSAIFQLASNTKRPIVMTLTETCFHLSKIAPQQLRINYRPVTGKRVPALLQLVAFIETECQLSQNCANALCQSGDLRKGLLQLQYLLLSGKERITSAALAVSGNSSWEKTRNQIYKSTKKKRKSDGERVKDNVLPADLISSLDNFSLMSMVVDIGERNCNVKFEPSMSLTESTNTYSNLASTNLELGDWLNDAVKRLALSDSQVSNRETEKRNPSSSKKQAVNSVNSVLTQITPNMLDRWALTMDYLSSIRTICRAEDFRNQANSKRGNRFFHYLYDSKFSNETTRTGSILSSACKMLQVKPTAET